MPKIKLSSIIAPYYYPLHKSVQSLEYSTYRLKGGRGSLKTSFIAAETFVILDRHPDICAAVFMKQKARLKLGAFAVYQSMLHRMNLDDEYLISKSPLRLTRIKTGQTIDFFGLDDPNKTKGVATADPRLYYGVLDFEELDQFTGNDEIETAKASIIRGGDLSWCFQCYNPPANANNWVNVDSEKDIPGRLVHTSDYTKVPVQWLGKAFLREVALAKAANYEAYEWRYLGKITGCKGLIFNNVKSYTIDPAQLFDYIFQGLDFGWADPKAFVRVGYDMDTRSIYFLDEFVASETPDSTVAQWICSKGYYDTKVILESAGGEEKAPVYRNAGIPCSVVNKGGGLKLGGIEWLASRAAIYIDPVRCPIAWQEFTTYEWKKDRAGNVISPNTPVDGNDHTIDSCRYAISEYFRTLGGKLDV